MDSQLSNLLLTVALACIGALLMHRLGRIETSLDALWRYVREH